MCVCMREKEEVHVVHKGGGKVPSEWKSGSNDGHGQVMSQRRTQAQAEVGKYR